MPTTSDIAAGTNGFVVHSSQTGIKITPQGLEQTHQQTPRGILYPPPAAHELRGTATKPTMSSMRHANAWQLLYTSTHHPQH
eukprot:104608-Amphidinium_carterae.1